MNERLFLPDEEAVRDLRTKRGKKRLPNTPLIRDLVQFFIESELHEHGSYLVDSLIESNPMMKVSDVRHIPGAYIPYRIGSA